MVTERSQTPRLDPFRFRTLQRKKFFNLLTVPQMRQYRPLLAMRTGYSCQGYGLMRMQQTDSTFFLR